MKIFMKDTPGEASTGGTFWGRTPRFLLLMTFLYMWWLFFGILIHVLRRKWRKIKKRYHERSKQKTAITN